MTDHANYDSEGRYIDLEDEEGDWGDLIDPELIHDYVWEEKDED